VAWITLGRDQKLLPAQSSMYSRTSSITIGNWSGDTEPVPSLDRERCSAAKVRMDCPSSPRCAVRVVAVWETTEPAQEFTAGGLPRPRTGQVAAASPASLGDTGRRLVHAGVPSSAMKRLGTSSQCVRRR